MWKLAIARIKLLRNKREVVVKQMRQDVASLLQSGQDATASIRVEHVIREQNIMAANEIIQLFCELVVVRLPIIAKQRECPADLKEEISSLIYAAPRCPDIPELLQIWNIFEKKYGKEFVSAAVDLHPDCAVNCTLIEKLSVRPPTGEVKLKLMKEIAKEYQIEWDTTDCKKELLQPPEELIEGPRTFVSAISMPVRPISSQGFEPNHPTNRMSIDPKSGFCKSNSVFYSKRKPMPLPSNESLDVTSFISSCAHHGKIAFIDASTGCHLTFTQLWQAVDSVATCLSNMGINKGHVVLILSPNSIFFPIICLSVMLLGAIITTANPLNTTHEIGTQIADSKPTLAFTTQFLLSKLDGTDLPIVLIGEHDNSASNARIVSYLEDMMRKGSCQSRIIERVSQDDTAALLYSSGMTGRSKGVMSSHRNLIVMVQDVLSRIQSEIGEQTVLCTVPMFHIYGLSFFVMGLLASGSTVVVLSRFEMNEMLCTITKYSVTYLPLAPPILIALTHNADEMQGRYNLGSLQSVLSGGAPLSKEVIQEFLALYPTVKILQGYGLTETTALGASTNTLEESMRYGTVGLLAASLDAKIVDPETGEPLSVNHPGELWLRGPSIMKGYFKNPEATASTLDSDGWLRTGDLCYIDNDGYIFVVDRLKELIKYKGYQVPPSELEALLLTHPEIADAAVIPFPDKEVGQFPMAYVVRKAGSDLSESAVMELIAKQVAPYKRIRRVTFVAAIPKNPSGKILRKDLVKLATSKL